MTLYDKGICMLKDALKHFTQTMQSIRDSNNLVKYVYTEVSQTTKADHGRQAIERPSRIRVSEHDASTFQKNFAINLCCNAICINVR